MRFDCFVKRVVWGDVVDICRWLWMKREWTINAVVVMMLMMLIDLGLNEECDDDDLIEWFGYDLNWYLSWMNSIVFPL